MPVRQPPLGTAVIAGHPLSRGLVGYWPLNEGGGEKAVSPVTPRLLGTITGTTVVPGPTSGTARKFNGSTDKIVCGSPGVSPGTSDLTLCAWWRTPSFALSGGANQRAISCRIDANNLFQFDMADGAGSTSAVSFALIDSGSEHSWFTSTAWNTNTWYFVALRYQRSGTVAKIFMNGVDQALTTASGYGPGTADNVLWMGMRSDSTAAYQGVLENVRLYNRALTPSEIWQLYVTPYAGLELPERRARRLAGGSAFTKSLAGGFTPAATIAKLAKLAKSGTAASSATLAKQAQGAKAGAVTSAAAIGKADGKAASGGCGPSGAPRKAITKPGLAGAITSAGVVTKIKVVLLALAGAIASAGSIRKSISKAFAGVLSWIGAITKSGGSSPVDQFYYVVTSRDASPVVTHRAASPIITSRSAAPLVTTRPAGAD